MENGKVHDNEAALIAFCRTQGADYIKTTADWIKKEYPGSADRVLPVLRQIYKEKTK